MKNIFLIISVLFGLESINAQNKTYWYKQTQIPLEAQTNKHYVVLQNVLDSSDLIAKFPTINIMSFGTFTLNGTINLLAKNTTNSNEKFAIVENFQNNNNPYVKFALPFYKSNGTEIGVSHLFYVKLKKSSDFTILSNMASENGITILGSNKFMPLVYTLSCSSGLNTIDKSNVFHQFGLFDFAEPDIMVKLQSCANDEHFTKQWALNNTGQFGGTSGTDINICKAWGISTGNPNIIVAVVDDGVELNHPDLINSIYPLSYDAQTGTSPSVLYGNHGTACAGIITALKNNNIGIAGIAPMCKLMSISSTTSLNPGQSQVLANAITYAWQNGASVISNSWGNAVYNNSMLDIAISNALSLGRNGLGCVVVFASGNDNAINVNYPARSNSQTITVGAANYCGQRKSKVSCDGNDPFNSWGSNFGSDLDVVAPGILISTTDRQGGDGYSSDDYNLDFAGTSSAAPHVAGIAALILSVNPNLTQNEVRDIIESTARKVGNFSYTTTIGRPNGIWHNEMGYGLVNAYDAVKMACQSITMVNNQNITTNANYSDCKIQSTNTNINAAKTTFNVFNAALLIDGFEVKNGAEFEIITY